MKLALGCALVAILHYSMPSFAASPSRQEETLEAYWPIHAPQKTWRLIAQSEKNLAGAKTLMSVTNRNLDEHQFELWFSEKPGQASGASDVERYEYCSNPGGEPWLFLRSYINSVDGTLQHFHPVRASRIVFSPVNQRAVDLIADGTYARCGSEGQPYLLWKQNVDSYRIQVWGYLVENPKWKWYWDATVTKAAPITNDCSKPPEVVKAIRVQESWWNNFKTSTGNFDLGSGETTSDGIPSGAGVKYGRTVWHASGQIPYFLIGKPDGTITQCAQSAVN